MKIRINILLPVCLALMMLACTSGLPDNDNRQKPQGEGEPVELSFKLYEASLTKALGATTLVDLDPGTKFTRLCQNAGTTFFYAQSPDFHKPGLCYYPKFLYL